MTLMQALAQAGGLTARGTERGIKVHRRDAAGVVQIIEHEDERPGRARRRHLCQRIALLRRGRDVLSQYLRIIWARKWLVLAVCSCSSSAAGMATTLLLPPKQYTAETSLIVEMRIDPALGALAPALAAPSYMATQVEILKSERVASRAVKMLGVERSAAAVAQWREATEGEDPARALFRRRAAARALGRARPRQQHHQPQLHRARTRSSRRRRRTPSRRPTMDVSVELRVAPARQSATFLDEQSKALRANLEEAQARMSKFQQNKGIVVTRRAARPGERALQHAASSQLAIGAGRAGRDRRRGSATPAAETSPDILQSGADAVAEEPARDRRRPSSPRSAASSARTIRTPIAARGADRRAEAAARGRNAARRRRRVGHRAAAARRRSPSCRRWSTCRRSSCCRCAPTATRSPSTSATSTPRSAPTTPSLSASAQLNMEGQNNQANTRLLSPAVEPLEPSRPKILARHRRCRSSAALAVGLRWPPSASEMLDRRVRDAGGPDGRWPACR